jgi:putative membrane protein insertion efficiency factor
MSPPTLRPVAARIAAWLASLPCQTLLLLVRGYRLLLKPSLGNACRFEPTCSQYALTALERHGALIGGTLMAGRLLRCHPWCQGGCDEVPAEAPRLFTRLGLGPRANPQNRAGAAAGPAEATQEPSS